jgi:hypothetical protein
MNTHNPMIRVLAFLFLCLLSAHGADLKQTKAQLLGKWTISAEATKKLPVDSTKHPWLAKKQEQLIKEGVSWNFREDGTVVENFGARSQAKAYYLLQDERGEVWLAIAKSDNFLLHKAQFVDGHLHLTAIARDEKNQEVPIVGTLALRKEE